MASNCAPPIPNPDISGIGVRVSFYLQYTLAVLSCTLSQESRDVEDALSTLAVTNMAYCVTTLVLGFKSPPELTLYDGLIVIYLTCFTLGFCYAITLLYAQTKGFHRHIYLLACIQCYLVLGTFLAICVTMPSFGSDAPCNHERRSSIFFIPVSMRTFRITGLVMTIFFLAFGTISMIYNNWFRRGKRGERPRYSDKKVLARFVTNTVVFGLCIAHVETLRLYNKPDPADQSWGFGQILPVFLIALPAMRTLSLLRHHLAPWMWPSRSVAKRSLLSTSRSDEETLAGHASLGRSSPGEISAPTTTGASLPSGSIMIPLQEHPSRVWAESSSLLVADKMAGSTVLDKSF